jgi:hypothetical protein
MLAVRHNGSRLVTGRAPETHEPRNVVTAVGWSLMKTSPAAMENCATSALGFGELTQDSLV